MSRINPRQEKILKLVTEKGFVSTDGLVEALGVTPQTIRRDINDLCERRLLTRFHGGAGPATSTENNPYGERKNLFSKAKQDIAQQVAAQVHDGASLFINIGTTTEAVTEALLQHRDLRIVTNNLNVARIAAQNETFEICCAGGMVRNRDGGIVGHSVTEYMRQFRMDFGIVGVSGIDADGTLLDFDARETETAKVIFGNSEQVFLVADHSKFGRRAMIRFGSLRDVDCLFTDIPIPDEYKGAVDHAGLSLHVANKDHASDRANDRGNQRPTAV